MRIAFVAPDDWTVWHYYRHLIEVLVNGGAEITVHSASGPHVPRLHSLGVEHVPVPYARFVAPLGDIQLFWSLRRAFRRHRFDVVQNFTVKANLYGALAAIASGVATIINTVEGAGILYSGLPNLQLRAIRGIAEFGLRQVRSRVFRYWFVNTYDRDLFVERGLATAEKSVVAISTGVDTQQFDPSVVSSNSVAAFRGQLSIPADLPLVTMVAGRLLRSKGVEVFVEMARRLREEGIRAQAVLVGPEEPANPDAIPPTIVRRAVEDGVVRWTGFQEDIPTVYAASDVVVVPTHYAEGTAKSITESMAMARALVCSDTPAVRQLVVDGREAIVVPPRDVGAVVSAVVELLQNPARRTELGRAAREAAVTRFDARREALAAVDRIYGLLRGWPPIRESTG